MIGAGGRARRAGQPLAFLAGLFGLYIALRILFWAPLFEISPFVAASPFRVAAVSETYRLAQRLAPADLLPIAETAASAGFSQHLFARRDTNGPYTATPSFPLAGFDRPSSTARLRHPEPPTMSLGPVDQFRLAAPLPSSPARGLSASSQAMALGAAPIGVRDIWSLDTWLFVRQDGSRSATAAALVGGLGFSQAGAVARLRVAPASPIDPQLYVRAASDLAGTGADLALGATIRPFRNVPLRIHAEGRASRLADGFALRPSAFATTGIEERELALGFAARGYAQAGYVGGRFATGFADGYLVAEREVVRFETGSLRVGPGIWGGVQKGVERLDVGPSATVSIAVADVPLRLSVDYRFKVAGSALPESGAALTLSTGF